MAISLLQYGSVRLESPSMGKHCMHQMQAIYAESQCSLNMNNRFSLQLWRTKMPWAEKNSSQVAHMQKYDASFQVLASSEMPWWSFSKVHARFKDNLNWLNTCLIILYYLPSLFCHCVLFFTFPHWGKMFWKAPVPTSIGSSLKLLSPSLHRHEKHSVYRGNYCQFCICYILLLLILVSSYHPTFSTLSWRVELHLDSLRASGAPDACLLTTRACCLLICCFRFTANHCWIETNLRAHCSTQHTHETWLSTSCAWTCLCIVLYAVRIRYDIVTNGDDTWDLNVLPCIRMTWQDPTPKAFSSPPLSPCQSHQ